MEQEKKNKLAGIDIGQNAVQFSVFDTSLHEMSEVYLPMETKNELVIEKGYAALSGYMKSQGIDWGDFDGFAFSLEDSSEENREKLKGILGPAFMNHYHVKIITRFRAFTEYIFRQDRVVWDRNTILFNYNNGKLSATVVDQIVQAKQKAYRAYMQEIELPEYDTENEEEKDQVIAVLLKDFLREHPTQMIYLTGEDFEGNWLVKTRNLLCAGRRVFLGQNIYANGAALMNSSHVELLDEGLVLMDSPEMVQYTIGVMTAYNGKTYHTPVTTIGREWYNTKGSLDIILDESHKVDIFYYNAKENMMESEVCEIQDLPARPEHTTRIRVSTFFTSATEGVVLLQDMGFGEMYPATGKVQAIPFSLVS